MYQTKVISLLMLVMVFQSCSTTKNEIFWVSGIKTECSSGAGKTQCLLIHKGQNLDNQSWENFYANIEGFKFEEGYLKKLEIRQEKIDNPPADGSSIKYTLVKELEKKPDYRANVGGSWILNRINDVPVDRSIKLPEMELNLSKMQVEGMGGCNNYTGQINKLKFNTIHFGNIVSTKRACIIKHIEQEYFNALNTVNTYQIKGDNLIFYDKNGRRILSYMKKVENNADQRLHDVWTAEKIMGHPINRMSPSPKMEINLTEMKVFGNDGCNNYTGEIKKASDNKIIFGNIASTKKMCLKMETADNFNKALMKVIAYKLEGLNLTLVDIEGKEVITFLKGD